MGAASHGDGDDDHDGDDLGDGEDLGDGDNGDDLSVDDDGNDDDEHVLTVGLDRVIKSYILGKNHFWRISKK